MAGRPRKEVTVDESQNQKTLLPNIKWKGEKEFRHDRFELSVEKSKTNMSFKKFDPQLVDKDHKHWFHAVDKKGRKRKYCTPMSGHFHEVMTSIDSEGNLVATCGPALRKVIRKLRSGKYDKIIERVQFLTETGSIEDNHTHEVTYDRSEMVSERHKQNQATKDAAKLQALQASRFDNIPQSQKERELQTENQAAKYSSMGKGGDSVKLDGVQIEGLES